MTATLVAAAEPPERPPLPHGCDPDERCACWRIYMGARRGRTAQQTTDQENEQ